jgi:hypothetical protein
MIPVNRFTASVQPERRESRVIVQAISASPISRPSHFIFLIPR